MVGLFKNINTEDKSMVKEVVTHSTGEWRGSFTVARRVSKTKKYHTCAKCGDVIHIGNSAMRYSGVFEAQFYCEYLHSECLAATDNP